MSCHYQTPYFTTCTGRGSPPHPHPMHTYTNMDAPLPPTHNLLPHRILHTDVCIGRSVCICLYSRLHKHTVNFPATTHTPSHLDMTLLHSTAGSEVPLQLAERSLVKLPTSNMLKLQHKVHLPKPLPHSGTYCKALQVQTLSRAKRHSPSLRTVTIVYCKIPRHSDCLTKIN